MNQPPSDDLVADALSLADEWLGELDLGELTAQRLTAMGLEDASVDLVALGKAAREMAAAADAWLGPRRLRRLVVADTADASDDADVLIGEHPVPGAGSLRAGRALVDFLAEPAVAEVTMFLVSGGASSLCALPAAPLDLADLASVWDAALASGVDITTLNQLRASTSAIAGGAVVRHVRTARSVSLVLVDNVVSGAPWVASGLTYDFAPDGPALDALLRAVDVPEGPLARRLRDAARTRAATMAVEPTTLHENVVLAEPATLLARVAEDARRRGYRVVDLGSRVHGDVAEVVATFTAALRGELDAVDRVALLGVGEVTVRVSGGGRGGRCQEFAWTMADALATIGRRSVVVARASDGRDFLKGVAGAWADGTTLSRAAAAGVDVARVTAQHDTFHGLAPLGQLLDGGHTGWNLCDVYLVLT